MNLKKNKIYIIISIFLIAKLLTIFAYKAAWWDASVYIGMGKYIYSLGSAGLWESSRPLLWPLMLGFLWKAGFGILAARLVEIIFGCLAVFLTYLIGKELFDEKAALLSSFFLAVSPTFFFFNGIMLTEIVSAFFSLLAVYLLLKNKHFLSGIFFGVAFMTRFLQLLAFIAVVLALIYNKKFKSKIFLGFAIAVLPYFIINQILYNNALFPFFQQAFLAANSGWLNHHPISYYFIGLFKDNFLYLFFIAGIALAYKKQRSRIIIFPLIILFLFFSIIRQKEMRFLIILLPYMYLLASHALVHFISLKKALENTGIFLILALFFLSSMRISLLLDSESSKTDKYEYLQARLEEAKGSIWISNPVMAAESDKRISKLIYYPFFWQDFEALLKESEKADFIFVDACDLSCRPSDQACENKKKGMIIHFRQNFAEAFSKQGECQQFVFKR